MTKSQAQCNINYSSNAPAYRPAGSDQASSSSRSIGLRPTVM